MVGPASDVGIWFGDPHKTLAQSMHTIAHLNGPFRHHADPITMQCATQAAQTGCRGQKGYNAALPARGPQWVQQSLGEAGNTTRHGQGHIWRNDQLGHFLKMLVQTFVNN